MSACDARLEQREQVAADTTAFHFSKPTGFSFEPGLAIDLTLPGPASTDVHDVRHEFSIVSAPAEPRLTIATRMRPSRFKRALDALPIGATVRIAGPFGAFAWHSDHGRPLVLVAGGIGITPFMSVLRHWRREAARQPISLVYSNRRPEDAAFLDELMELARGHSDFSLLATMTQMESSVRRWSGDTTRINETLLKKAAGGLQAPMHYLAGPPGMVEAVRRMLTLAAVGDEHIRSEEFFGY